ncbi:LysE family translocator [Nocardioides sp. Bht2]|uniref:LysE family translocator n=1 Tax=Nocardioides sp. Bht2 TaxID=3392297 RepID=UPI0039B4D149
MNLTWEQLVGFTATAFVVIVIPGPSVVFTISRALAHGRAVALATVVGNTLGLGLVLILVAAGLGAVVTTSAMAFTVLKVVGAAYLIWLGIQAIMHRKEFHPEQAGADGPAISTRTAIRQGFIVGVSNPKSFLIFAALLPQFLNTSGGSSTLQMLVLGSVAVLLGLVSDSVWAVVAAQLRDWFARSPRRSETLGVAGGSSMIALGIGLALARK